MLVLMVPRKIYYVTFRFAYLSERPAKISNMELIPIYLSELFINLVILFTINCTGGKTNFTHWNEENDRPTSDEKRLINALTN